MIPVSAGISANFFISRTPSKNKLCCTIKGCLCWVCFMLGLKNIPVGSVSISSIVLAELWYGVKKSKQVHRNTQALKDFLNFLIVENWPQDATEIYGDKRYQLEKTGCIVGPNDLFIAAHALSLDATLVTNNIREFQRIDGLRLENWVLP